MQANSPEQRPLDPRIEQYLLPEAELREKLKATNALISDQELEILKGRSIIRTSVLETVAPYHNLSQRRSGVRPYVFRLHDVGVYTNDVTRQKYLIYLLDTHGYKHFTRMRWNVEDGLLEMTIQSIQYSEPIAAQEATIYPFMTIWRFENPGLFLEKGGNYKGDDFIQALPLLHSFADLKL